MAERRRRRERQRPEATADTAKYRQIVNPFEPLKILSDDQIEHIHRSALALLQDIGLKTLHPDARQYYRAAGADVNDDTLMVRFDPAMIEELMSHAPSKMTLHALNPARNVHIGGRNVIISPVGGAPNVTDRIDGRRPGNHADYCNFLKLAQYYDVINVLSMAPESADIPPKVRHLETTYAQLTLSDKPSAVYCRGTAQVADHFEMIRIANRLTAEDFENRMFCHSIINMNSPLQLDNPMAEGLIDFAKANQFMMVTPFTLAGAMAPITLAGALTEQHAEALAGMTLSQCVRKGAPVGYGGFTSNVDMKSGAPAFGTPEYTKAAIASGQLARRVGVPWRSSNVNAANIPDAQSAWESQMSLWGALMGGANIIKHGAGWLEGGLAASYEKFIQDIEMLQMMVETFQPIDTSDAAMARDAMEEVGPAGHFFGCAHTMARYDSAFYAPIASDWSNFGNWTENGSVDTYTRCTNIWQKALEDYQQPPLDADIKEELEAFIARRKEEGGAELS